MGEAGFIAALRQLATSTEARGLADDCAVSGRMVVTHDMMVAGVHFPADADPADVAWKLVAVNLSDLAAKGARPVGVLLGYMLGDEAWDARFLEGLAEALSGMEVALWGGDTVRGRSDGQRSFGLTAIGEAVRLPVPSRSGARAGDALWVTGEIGAAMLGFEGAGAAEIARFSRPVPRIAEGLALAPLVTAMMDVSDGLLLDASRMAEASGVSIAIDSAAVPFPAALPADRRDAAMRWGDDYELLFTLPAGTSPPVAATRIGEVMARGANPLLVDGAVPEPDRPLGYQH